jgi:nucleotide-binding universal stress UspA family protein
MFKKILVPLDGSTAGSESLKQALLLVGDEPTQIDVLYVIDVRLLEEARLYLPMGNEIRISTELSPRKITDTYYSWAEQVVVRTHARAQSEGVALQAEIITGVPYREITTRSASYDLLVTSAWETGKIYPGPFLGGYSLGKITDTLLHSCDVPLLLSR